MPTPLHHAAICARDLDASKARIAEATSPAPEPTIGFFLLSFSVGDLDGVLPRLAELGFGREPRRIEVPGPVAPVAMATVRDPDGVRVELIGA